MYCLHYQKEDYIKDSKIQCIYSIVSKSMVFVILIKVKRVVNNNLFMKITFLVLKMYNLIY
jgi:hypothetical protein